MNRTRMALAAGLAVLAVGLWLSFGASGLATHWEQIGPNVWGGTADPATTGLYRVIGLAVFAFGLLLIGGAYWRWLGGPER